MRLLDPRLLRRARPARLLLGLDTALGLATALLVLAQAVLLARVAARAFGGASLSDVSLPLELLVAVVAARAATAWGFEAVGRRAATGVLSQLRLDLVEARLRDHPAALDGAESAEVATTAVNGVDALETAFARYLPQVFLAAAVPVAVLVLVAAIDPLSAGIMLLTLPLVPVFMWLIGRATAKHTRERWQALTLLATHFSDVVRGLPTLRAFNRGEAQTERIEQVSDEYRRAAMGTLQDRVPLRSGARARRHDRGRAHRGHGRRAARRRLRRVRDRAHRAPARARALPAAAQPRRAVPRERRRARGLRAPARPDRAAAGGHGRGRASRRAPAAPRSGSRESPSPIRPGRSRCSSRSTSSWSPGETVALVGESGGGKSTAASLLLRLCEPTAGRVTVGGVDLAACDAAAWRAQVAWVPQDPTLFRGTVADNIRLGDAGGRRRAACGPRPSRRAPTRSSLGCPTGTGRSSARAGAGSRPASGSGSRSPARSCATRRS